MAVVPPNNLPPDSQKWGRAVEGMIADVRFDSNALRSDVNVLQHTIVRQTLGAPATITPATNVTLGKISSLTKRNGFVILVVELTVTAAISAGLTLVTIPKDYSPVLDLSYDYHFPGTILSGTTWSTAPFYMSKVGLVDQTTTTLRSLSTNLASGNTAAISVTYPARA